MAIIRDREEQALKYAMLKERKKRWENDPINQFTPFAKQRLFMEAVLGGKYNESWYFGANRSGKSDIGARIDADLARFGNRDPDLRFTGGTLSDGTPSGVQVRDRATSGWVVSLDFPSSRDIIQPKLFNNGHVPPGQTHPPFIPERELLGGSTRTGWNKTDSILKLKNGSIIGFKSADSGQEKFYGAEKDYVHFDEPPPKPIYNECCIRVGHSRLTVFGTCTILPPPGVVGGISWLFGDKVKPWQRGERPDLYIISAAIYDNPYISRDEIARLEGIYPTGSLDRKIRLEGQLIPGVSGARVYSNFRDNYNVGECLHPGPFIPLRWTWDFNVAPMVSLVGYKDPQWGIWRVFKEFFLETGDIPSMCEEFIDEFPSHQSGVMVYGDATGKWRSAQYKKSNYDIIEQEMKKYPSPVTFHISESNPPVPLRINTVNGLLKGSNRTIGLMIDPSCSELIADLEEVVGDGKGGIKKAKDTHDPYYKRTHLSDALGYLLTHESPLIVDNTDMYKPIESMGDPLMRVRYRGSRGRVF